jgi:hypothetical protein
MWSWYSFTTPGPMIVILQGRNMAVREQPWFTIVSIASLSPTGGSPVIRSIATLWKGQVFSSVGMWYIRVFLWCMSILFVDIWCTS